MDKISEFGRIYYKVKKDENPKLPNIVREMDVLTRFGIYIHMYADEYPRCDSGISTCVQKEDIYRYYSMLAPIVQVYAIGVDGAYGMKDQKIIVEPYVYSKDSKELSVPRTGYVIDIMKAMTSCDGDDMSSFISSYDYYSTNDHKMIINKFKSIDENAKSFMAYYTDSNNKIISQILNMRYGYNFKKILYGIAEVYCATAGIHMDPSLKDIMWSRFYEAFCKVLDRSMKTLTLTENEIVKLLNITVFKNIKTKDEQDALTKVLTAGYGFNVPASINLNDPNIKNTLTIMKYNLSLDLEEIQRLNRQYTMVIARTEPQDDGSGNTYIIMYAETPSQFKLPSVTGFSRDEMAKLLR